jgi:hypothetical protein
LNSFKATNVAFGYYLIWKPQIKIAIKACNVQPEKILHIRDSLTLMQINASLFNIVFIHAVYAYNLSPTKKNKCRTCTTFTSLHQLWKTLLRFITFLNFYNFTKYFNSNFCYLEFAFNCQVLRNKSFYQKICLDFKQENKYKTLIQICFYIAFDI